MSGDTLGGHAKNIPKTDLPIAPGKAKMCPEYTTVINFHMWPNQEILPGTELSASLAPALEG